MRACAGAVVYVYTRESVLCQVASGKRWREEEFDLNQIGSVIIVLLGGVDICVQR